jgi:hypothetical protein
MNINSYYNNHLKIIFSPIQAGEDITACCSTGDGCCGPDWGLHCCNFIAKICCYGDERVFALHHHSHRHWHWKAHCKLLYKNPQSTDWTNIQSDYINLLVRKK